MQRTKRPKLPVEPPADKQWSVGEMAKLTQSTLRAIRFYEQQGLLSVRTRTTGRHRRYSTEEFERLRAILELRRAGLSLDEIRQIVEVRRQHATGGAAASDLKRMLDAQMGNIRERVVQLQRLQTDLQCLRDALTACSGCDTAGANAKTCGSCQKFSTGLAENTMIRALWRQSR